MYAMGDDTWFGALICFKWICYPSDPTLARNSDHLWNWAQYSAAHVRWHSTRVVYGSWCASWRTDGFIHVVVRFASIWEDRFFLRSWKCLTGALYVGRCSTIWVISVLRYMRKTGRRRSWTSVQSTQIAMIMPEHQVIRRCGRVRRALTCLRSFYSTLTENWQFDQTRAIEGLLNLRAAIQQLINSYFEWFTVRCMVSQPYTPPCHVTFSHCVGSMHMHKWYAYAYARAYAGCTPPTRCVGGMYMYEWYVDVYVRTYVGCTPRGRAYGHGKTTFMRGMIFRNTLIL